MQTFQIRKPAVRSRHGLVAAQNRHAAEAGAAVLAQGGNAMDAAVVTALVLSVVEPWLSGIGGGGFLLHADGLTGAVDTLDFNVLAPRALNPADYPLVGGNDGDWFNWPAVQGDRNVSGYGSICVPGAVAGFASALEKYGTLSWAQALQPAIDQATLGLELDWFTCLTLAIDAAGLARYPASAELFLDAGRAPRASDRHPPARRPMPAKMRLLQRLALAGPRDFYEGETARALVQDLQAGGSVLALDDFARYQPTWNAPLVGQYRGHVVHAIPGLSGGPTFLSACDALSAAGLGPDTPGPRAALAIATAIRDAYERRLSTMGPAATADAGCTSHISVVDASGSMVSLTNTLLSRFGSKVALPGAGMLMNNGMMWFDPRPGQPNSMAPGAKPLANMCPLILHADGRPWLAIGAAGGRTIFPTVLQIVSGMLAGGLSLEDAFHAPRMDASTATIRIDPRAGADVAAAVASRFPVEIVPDTVYPVNFAIPSAVQRQADGNLGMAHPGSPWAAVAIGGAADAH
jgi:gamma-glutamyltranspeptidase/glutathione hydrolase